MPYVSVHIDADEVLKDLSDADLLKEMDRRRKRKGGMKGGMDHVEPWTPPGFADDLRSAFYARNASRFEALLTALERYEPADA